MAVTLGWALGQAVKADRLGSFPLQTSLMVVTLGSALGVTVKADSLGIAHIGTSGINHF